MDTAKDTEPSLKEEEEWSQDLSVSSWKAVNSNSPELSGDDVIVFKEESEMKGIQDLTAMVAEELDILDLNEGAKATNV